MTPPVYKIDNLVHSYNHKPVLEIARLTVEPASILGLVGPNGSGKSTLLKLMAFIFKPTQGKIMFRGRPAFPFDEAVRSQVTLLTQEPYLMKRTVFKNVAYGLKVRGAKENWQRPVNEALEMVGLDPGSFSQRQYEELSGGEAQRVALAARLIFHSQVPKAARIWLTSISFKVNGPMEQTSASGLRKVNSLAPIILPLAITTARSTTLRSSLTLPGQRYAISIPMALWVNPSKNLPVSWT